MAQPQLVVRQEHATLELLVRAGKDLALKRLVEGNLRGLEEGAVGDVPHAARSAASQDDDVPHGAFGGLDGAKSFIAAVRGGVADGDERVGRALSSRRLEKAARLSERISAARLFRGHQGLDGVGCLIGLPQGLWQEVRHVGVAGPSRSGLRHGRGCGTVARA